MTSKLAEAIDKLTDEIGRQKDGLTEAVQTLANEVREQSDHFTEYIRSMQDTIDDLRTEIQHAVRNLLPEFQLQSMAKDPTDSQWAAKLNRQPEQITEIISCQECDAQMNSLATALREGWTELWFDPDGKSWNYLGWCPQCMENQEERVEAMQRQYDEESAAHRQHLEEENREKPADPQRALFS